MNTEEARKISLDEWEQFPAKPPKAPDHWAPIMDAIEQGDVYALPYADDKDLRGKRIGLGRRASQRGFKLEIRVKDNLLAVRRSDVSPTPRAQSEAAPVRQTRRSGRPRRDASLEAAATADA